MENKDNQELKSAIEDLMLSGIKLSALIDHYAHTIAQIKNTTPQAVKEELDNIFQQKKDKLNIKAK